jgi:hypothetical protein
MKALIAAAVLALAPMVLAPAAASAQSALSGADAATQRGYVMTLDLVQRYAAATKALKAAETKDPSLKAEDETPADSPQAGIAKLKAHPRLYAPYKAQGFSERDAVLLGVAIIEASFAANEKDLSAFPNVSPTQAAFMKTHDAQLRTILKGVFTVE